MTRAHATRQLLALGPLTFRDYWQITGWPEKIARKVLGRQVELQRVRLFREPGTHRSFYRLAR